MKFLHKATLGGQAVYKWPKTDDIVTLESVLELQPLILKILKSASKLKKEFITK